MPEISFKMFYNNEAASLEQLEQVEEIIVEQEENMAWEARIKIPICADERGQWSEGDSELITSLTRIRIEFKVADNPYVPVIDGPVVAYESSGSSEPGQSVITFLVRDDSVYLNREEGVEMFEDRPDHEIAEELLNRYENITLVDADEVPDPDSTLENVCIRRGTEMDLLRQLARRNHMYVAVLPGEEPGESRGFFKSFPSTPSNLSPLILLGSGRNIESIEINHENLRPSRVRAATLRIGDKVVVERESSFRNIDLLGEEHPFNDDETETSMQILPPHQGESVDLQHRANVQSERSTFSFDASGNVSSDCYDKVLSPYQVISVQAVKDRQVGNYRISQVTHTLTRSTYSQSFQLKRNAITESQSNEVNGLINDIF